MNIRGGKQKQYNNREGDKNIRDSYISRTNRGLLEVQWEGGWAKWVRGIKESTSEVIVTLYANLDVNLKNKLN